MSKATLKTANRQYSKIDNDYEMTFGNETAIELCHETDVPRQELKLTPLSELSQVTPGDFVGKFLITPILKFKTKCKLLTFVSFK